MIKKRIICALAIAIAIIVCITTITDLNTFKQNNQVSSNSKACEQYTVDVAGSTSSIKSVRAAKLSKLKRHKVSALESEMFRQINAQRKKHGIKALKWDKNLFALSIIRSRETAVKWSHTRPNGKKFSNVFYQYNVLTATRVGENIARGGKDVKVIVNAWMNSKTHRRLILSSKYTKTGLHIAVDKNGKWFSEELFSD